MVVGADSHDPSAVAALLAKHLGDCGGEGLRGHACDYATKPIVKMPCNDSNRFRLAAPLAVAQVTPYRLVHLRDETRCMSIVSPAALI
jgi:hypothetical protein